MTIGRVEAISLLQNEENYFDAVVVMSIDEKYSKIPVDSAAKILTAGLLGDNYIEIVPGHAEEFLKQDSTIEMTSQAVLLEDLISKIVTEI